MKFRKSFFSISILTFLVGCLAVLLIGLVPNFKEVSSNSSESINDFQTFTPVEPIPVVVPESPQRFTATHIADGFGSWQGFITNDGQQLVRGSKGFETPKKARAELKKRIKEAVRIVENTPNYREFNNIVGERIILINPPDKNGKETASILWYDGGQFIHSIDAPSLELALEFESEQRKLITDSRFRQLKN